MNGALDAQRVRLALADVVDPCSLSIGSPTSVVDLGLVQDVHVDGGAVRIAMVLTDPSCVFWRDIRRHVADRVAELEGVTSVDVRLDTTTLWSPARATRR